MKRRPLPKLPVPDAARCTMQDGRGKWCTRRLMYEVTRTNGTKFMVCQLCAIKLKELTQSRPDLFEPLRFSEVK